MQHPDPVPTVSRPSVRPRILRGAAAGAAVGALAAVLVIHPGGSAPVATVTAVHTAHRTAAVALAQAPGRLDADLAPAATPTPTPAPTAPPAPVAVPVAATATAVPKAAPAYHSTTATTTTHAAAAPAPAPTAAPTAAPAPQSAPSGTSAQTLSLVNQDRASGGLAPLSYDPALARAAAEHAAQNAANDQMSHNGLQADVAQQGASWHYLGECLGEVRPNPDASYINTLWMHSSEHRPIIMNGQYTRAGVGWARAANGDWFVSLIVAG
jgi:uncharacterized protein YkwD